ncbi:bifunctional oligoribonuclease and PAP phosphatase NrnA [Thermotomaculum hydrothermale]|uniref:Bifunctional oligoribonuclease and PAP phosphatase NrnA n=1 Tax=Thermotomaculum hydrothermale TaxID=981385 RepID=A0A7R6PP23_9BACT|nr:bifunctional oligoribonuclease/PAP phosphatase NrnA [Thermotomaculum hydrothermale]BBB33592.1 bifunctional oligoribonuclease and PAP phosphatase NrnA [Thermotomaculum hydrothermale]
MKEFEKLKQFIDKHSGFVLVGHKNADGDCIGTMSAFGIILEKLGKSAVFIVADPVPHNYFFLKKVKDFKVVNTFDCKQSPVILFECGNMERSGINLENYGERANFDHHPDNKFYAELNIVNPEASSVGEMAAIFFREYFENLIDSDVANSLYTAIHTDTGGFAYSNVKKSTFEVASYLMSKGLDNQLVCNEVYGNNKIEKTRLLGYYLENLEVKKMKNFNLCYGVLALKDLERFNCTSRDTENFANYPRGIMGVDVGVFFLEVEQGVFKVSLRSKGKVIVNKVAANLGGGGHKFAAGCTVKGEWPRVLDTVLKEFEKDE